MSNDTSKTEIDDVDSYGLPRIPFRGYYDVKRCDERRHWVEKFTSTNLRHVGEWWADEGKEDSCSTTKLKGNAENVIGLAKIPIGVAGPLLIHGDHVNGHVLCPFATTEGALIASATRGATALSRAGGVMVQVGKQRMLRAPAFMMRSIHETHILWNWLTENFRHLKQQVSLFSQHCVLIELVPFYFGKAIIVQFVYETGDAAGQNMTTSATWHACKWALNKLEEELPGVKVVKLYIESNVSGDKKMAAAQLQNTRGWFAQADSHICNLILYNSCT